MRLLMLNNEFPPLGGGTATVTLALLRQFSLHGDLEIDLITSGRKGADRIERFGHSVRIFRVPVNSSNIHHATNLELIKYSVGVLPKALSLIRGGRYDLCFAWCSLPSGVLALTLRRLTGMRYITRVSGPDIPGFETRYARLYPLLTPFVRATWSGSDAVIAKCQSEADMIRAVEKEARIRLIPNGVDLDAFKPPAAAPAFPPLRLTCVGRLIERKGQRHLLQAVKRLSNQGIDAVLDLVGTGDSENSYHELAASLGLGERVRFLGYIPRDQILACYQAAHVFVLPSYNEGMSIATLEAMASGLPIVSTRTGGTAELVDESVNGFTFDWSDIDTLVGHLKKLAGDWSLLRRMGSASRLRAEAYGWPIIARQYRELFRDIGLRCPAKYSPHASPAGKCLL